MPQEREDSVTTLVCGLVDEEPVSMLISSLQKKGADFLIIDQETLADQVKLRWQVNDRGITGQIKVGDEVLDISEIRSVYHRFMDVGDVLGSSSPLHVATKTRSILHSLMNLFDVIPGRIVNRRRPMMSNNSKPYQSLLIKQAGLAIPDTLITNDAHFLKSYAFSNGPLIYKSISSIRSIVAPLDDKSVARAESLRHLPTQFQRKLKGFNVRVHVIGKRLATQILTSATDYRYAVLEDASAEFKPYELNVELRRRCLRLARICQLSFAGIDLMICPGKVYCLEVNPSPAYSYYQKITGQPISDALADYLMHNWQPHYGSA
jgi:hypothetical protein